MMKRTVLMLAALLCLMSMMLTLGGCQIIDRIFGGDDGDEESDARIATLEEQALAIGESIEALRLVDAQLGAYIDALEESGEGSEQSIASLKSNQSSLEGRIKSLEDLRDGLATKEWAEGAFATLKQQVAVQNDLDSIRASLATVQTDLGDTERELQSAIAQSEEDIKAWVNKEFYTKSDIDSKLTVIEGSISNGDDGLKAQIDEQKTALADAKTELTTAYQKAITDAITNNNGVIDTKISDAITAAKKDYDSKINDISARLDTLAAQVEKNKDDIADILKRLDELEAENQVLKNQIRCLKDDHDWDATKTTLAWNDDLSACDLHVECLNCGGKFDVIQSDLVLSGNILTAKFKQEDQTLDLTDTTKLTNSQIQGAMVHLVGDGTADSVDITLTLAEGAGSKVFDAIRNGLSGAKDGSVNLTLNGAKKIPSNAFRGCTALGSITLGDSVKVISDRTFLNCTSLTSVTIPEGVTSIDIQTFYNCSSLETVTIPKGVTGIGQEAFYKCSSLKSVTIPSTVTEMDKDAFGNCKALESVYYNGDIAGWCKIEFANNYANPCAQNADLYIGGTLLTDLSIPEDVESIGYCAFVGCKSLTSVTVPSTVTKIGEGAFGYCPSLKSVTVGGTIGEDMFYECPALDSVTLAEGVTTINNSAFYGCKSLKSIEFPSTLTAINTNAFVNSGLTSITIPDTVKNIGENVFKNCTSLKTVTIGKGITTIPKQTFYKCTALESVTIPSTVTEIGQQAFYQCSSLASISIPSGVTTIGANAFCGTALTAVTIPNSVTSVGEGMFKYCSQLKTVVLGSGVFTIGRNFFAACSSLESITFFGEIKSLSRSNVFNSNDTEKITLNFAQDQRVLTVVDANYWGVASGASYVREITDEDAKKDFCGYKFKNIYTWAFADLSDLTTDEIEKTVGSMVSIGYRDISISVPSDNTADCFTAINNAISGQVNGSICLMISGDGSKGIDIGREAFAKCYALGYLIIGDGINTIGEHAFYDCRYLKSLTITGNVDTMKAAVFFQCDSLESVTISGSVNTIDGTFTMCRSLASLTITGSVNSIGDSTFYGCSKLTEVTLPKSIEYLGKGIFNQCNNFTDGTISYAGTMEEWKSINKFHDVDGDRYWTWLSNITKVKCTDGTLSGDDVT